VHDAVRPLVTPSLIAEVVRATERFGAAVVGVRVKDTIKIESGGFFTTTLDRAKLWAVQTPQGFRFDILKRAHVAAQRSALLATDDAALVERLNVPVRVVEGDYRNIKITTEDDIKLAKMLLK
jgi:2-C-methyl-D-erythritol 4-phosphate cytidylyltransferase